MGSPWPLAHPDSSIITSQFHYSNHLLAPAAKIQRLDCCRYEVSADNNNAVYFPSNNLNLHDGQPSATANVHTHIPDDLPSLNYIGSGIGIGSYRNHQGRQLSNENGQRKRDHFRQGLFPTGMAKRVLKQEFYSVALREIPTWSIYFNDQKHRLVQFTDIQPNPVKPDDFLNRCVSLCFEEVCITDLAMDAIVNSTCTNYAGESGVDRKIHEKAGKGLRESCKNLPNLTVGESEVTHGFLLPAKYIIHTNGPDSDNPEMLKKCYESCLNRLLEYNLRTIAFPCIGTGKKGLTRKLAAVTALDTVRNFLERNRQKVDRVIFCLHNYKDVVIYRRYMQIYFPHTLPEVEEF